MHNNTLKVNLQLGLELRKTHISNTHIFTMICLKDGNLFSKSALPKLMKRKK